MLSREWHLDEKYIKRLTTGDLGAQTKLKEITENDENRRIGENDASWSQKYFIHRKLVLICGKLCWDLFVELCR